MSASIKIPGHLATKFQGMVESVHSSKDAIAKMAAIGLKATLALRTAELAIDSICTSDDGRQQIALVETLFREAATMVGASALIESGGLSMDALLPAGIAPPAQREFTVPDPARFIIEKILNADLGPGASLGRKLVAMDAMEAAKRAQELEVQYLQTRSSLSEAAAMQLLTGLMRAYVRAVGAATILFALPDVPPSPPATNPAEVRR